jgi:hypothetical protein
MSGPGGARIIITTGQESHDNPFLADGELSKKAETIVRHSTISRTELKIYDPDKEPIAEPAIVNEQVVPAQAGVTNAAPRPDNIGVKQNGNVDDGTAVTPASVEVEVGAGNASAAEPQKAEEVKVEKDPKCKCCVLQ